jgi:heat shock protein HslJ
MFERLPIHIWLILLTVFALSAHGCAVSRQTLVRELGPEVVVTRMTALRIAPLTMVDGCLRIGDGEASHVVVWPPDFEVTTEGNVMWVYYDGHEVEIQLGQAVSAMGGEVKSVEAFDERTRKQVPTGCDGPYWLMGGVSPAGESAGPGAPGDLVGTEWQLVSLHGQHLIAGTQVILRFGDRYLVGNMTCNGYGGGPDSGGYSAAADGAITVFKPLAVTVQLCAEPTGVMEQEAAYIEALQHAAAYQAALDTLQVADATGEVTLVFERAK